MLIHVSKRTQHVTPIVGDAHMVITVQKDGGLLLSGYLLGEWNTTYANGRDTVIDAIPDLLAELRAELARNTPAG